MSPIKTAHAYANNEVVYIAWQVDAMIAGCLGFEVTRIYLDAQGNVKRTAEGKEDRVPCASWLGFENQHNPHWLPQDTSVWPVQKLSWRDLTVRKRRDRPELRDAEVDVCYEIRAMGDLRPGMAPGPDPTPRRVEVVARDDQGRPILDAAGRETTTMVDAYEGPTRRLGYLGDPIRTPKVRVTRVRPPFESTFTNGVLSAQWLRRVLLADGEIRTNELLTMISTPDNKYRHYLAGDVIALIADLLAQPGTFHLSLYELEDVQLVDLLVGLKGRAHVILANSAFKAKGGWDSRNRWARERLKAAGVDVQDRLFNNEHIGHNKFVVHVAPDGTPRAVLTGSTNWTATGLAGQTNNALLIRDTETARVFLDYWTRMRADPQPAPPAVGAKNPHAVQSQTFRHDNAARREVPLSGGRTLSLWFSPNTKGVTKGTHEPPDLKDVYAKMQGARQAILFLAFYPAQQGTDSIVGESVRLGGATPTLIVQGAVSSPKAMPNYKDDAGDDEDNELASPRTFFKDNVAVVRASRIDDRDMFADFGAEPLTALGTVGAIIHDKIVVIDPLSPDCHVILGSHNLGYKASYVNDENLVIVSGDQALAQAYAVHVLDVYDHYRFRAVAAERKAKGEPASSGFLHGDDHWLTGYVQGDRAALSNYFAKG